MPALIEARDQFGDLVARAQEQAFDQFAALDATRRHVVANHVHGNPALDQALHIFGQLPRLGLRLAANDQPPTRLAP